MAMWTFAPFNDPAYPAAIKRVLMMRDGALVMETRTLCQANMAACDAFLAATQVYGRAFSERYAKQIIADAQMVERERVSRRKYQQRVTERARALYDRPMP